MKEPTVNMSNDPHMVSPLVRELEDTVDPPVPTTVIVISTLREDQWYLIREHDRQQRYPYIRTEIR